MESAKGFCVDRGLLDCTDAHSLWIGKQYDWGQLFMPSWPYCKGQKKREGAPIFGVNDPLSILLGAVFGLQHALAMIGGLITPPLLLSQLSNDPATQRYLVSTSLIISGFCTLLHVMQFKIPFTNKYYGSGIVSVCGTSFTTLSIGYNVLGNLLADGHSFDQAWGKLIGTTLITWWVEVVIGLLPPKLLKRIFPPAISGLSILLIGVSLINSAFDNWGGGAYCEEYAVSGLPPTAVPGCLMPDATGQLINTTCYEAPVFPLCTGNGSVELPFGAPEYLGLGFIVFVTLVFIEIFGSPFMRNSGIIISLLFGYLMAGVIPREGKHYVSTQTIQESDVITFLWVKTFPIGIYWPAVLPFVISFVVIAIEDIGDITAAAEASGLDTTTEEFKQRTIGGGLIGNGFNSLFAALGTGLPQVAFSQNCGVIALTRCGSRTSGFACGVWLILFGILAKVGAFFVSIPNCVLGGVTAFLFASIVVSGIQIVTLDGLSRRTRFILSLSLAIGLGVTLVPSWASNHIWPIVPSMSSGLESFRDSCVLVLESGYCVGSLLAIVLHLILPEEEDKILEKCEVTPNGRLYDPSVHNTVTKVHPDELDPMDQPVSAKSMERSGDDTAHGSPTHGPNAV